MKNLFLFYKVAQKLDIDYKGHLSKNELANVVVDYYNEYVASVKSGNVSSILIAICEMIGRNDVNNLDDVLTVCNSYVA